MDQALDNLDKANTPEELLQSALIYVKTRLEDAKKQENRKSKIIHTSTTSHSQPPPPAPQSSILSEIQILFLKKTAQNPLLLKTLLTLHLKDVLKVLNLAATNPKELQSALQLLIAKLSSIGNPIPKEKYKEMLEKVMEELEKESRDDRHVDPDLERLKEFINLFENYNDGSKVYDQLEEMMKKSTNEQAKDEL